VNKMEMIKRLSSLMRTLMPWVCLRMSGESPVPSLWDGHAWQQVRLDDLPQTTPFGHYVWLIADENTCFRNRCFPADMIDSDSLDEAVALDIQSWSPWGVTSGYFHWPVRDGEHWRVAIWTWDADLENTLHDSMLAASDTAVTHVMPELAWYAASAGVAALAPALLLQPVQDRLACIFVDKSGIPNRVALVSGAAEGHRFRRSIGSPSDGIRTFLLEGDESEENVSDIESCMNQRVKWVIQESMPDSVEVL